MKICVLESYTYTDPCNAKNITKSLLIDSSSKPEEVLFRLLLGTIDFKEKYNRKIIKQRNNLFHIPYKVNSRVSKRSVYDCNIEIEGNEDEFEKYIRKNRVNMKIYKNILHEFTSYFYHQNKREFVASFVNLYRCLEHMSYTFPLVYASKAKEYWGTYKELQSFFEGKGTSELKFFKRFQEVLINKDIRNLTFEISFENAPIEIKGTLEKILKNIYMQAGVPNEMVESNMVKYDYMLDFIVTCRNRYFHFLASDPRNNLKIKEINMDYFFEAVNIHMANWLAYIYSEVVKFSFEQI